MGLHRRAHQADHRRAERSRQSSAPCECAHELVVASDPTKKQAGCSTHQSPESDKSKYLIERPTLVSAKQHGQTEECAQKTPSYRQDADPVSP